MMKIEAKCKCGKELEVDLICDVGPVEIIVVPCESCMKEAIKIANPF